MSTTPDLAAALPQPGRTLRMSSLADLANASLSRLSYLVTRLEARGLVRREPDPEDGRFCQGDPDRQGLPDSRRSRTQARGTCAVTRHRRPVARAAATPRPRRRPHNVAHRHLGSELAGSRAEADQFGTRT